MPVAAPTTKVDPEIWTALAAKRFGDLPRRCQSSVPGLSDSEIWRDWAERETTPDQLRIEDYIDAHDLRGRRILHIGLGNSGLAKRFHSRAAEILGTTVVPHEVDYARSLQLPNYRPIVHNKYSGASDSLTGRFDFIVDNNPTTFCCCLVHFQSMLKLYADKLSDHGLLVTDRVGLGWSHIPDGNSRWAFDFDDLAAAGAAVGLTASGIDKNIYVLSRQMVGPLPPVSRLKWLANKVARRLARARR